MHFKLYYLIFFNFLFLNYLNAQEVIWANKLLELTDKYQFENNFSWLALGPPTLYPTLGQEDKHDPYSEGYILNYTKSKKKNVMVVGFPKPANANQIVIGGIFNVGSIDAIYLILKNNKEKLIFQETKEPGKVRFKSFNVSIPLNTIYGLKLVFDHSKINNWNIIKGIGILNSNQLYKIAPSLIEDTTHHHKKEVVGETINSSDCFEFSPKIAPDGKTLYFVKECANQNDQDIWYSEIDNQGKWSEAKNIGIPLNNSGHNFVASISPDGNTLILGNKYKENGTDGGDGVSISHRDENGKWKLPEAIEIPNFTNLNAHANFYMGPNGDVLLMAVQDQSSVGDLDLYVSLLNKNTKKWSEPINLGLDINTPYAEDYPYLGNDNKTLFFSSKGYIGYGGHDIMVARRKDDTWKNWEKPKNLGPFVNTKLDDKGFVIANKGDHAYFNSASFNDSTHHMDIYKVDLPKMLYQTPRTLITGVIIDKDTKLPLRGSVMVKDEQENTIAFCSSNPNNGKYVLAVPFGNTYNLIAESIDHFKTREKLPLLDTSKSVEVIKDFELKKFLDSGEVYKAKDILFEYNKAILTQTSYDELNKIADWISQQNKAKFEIAGHTDDKGSEKFNLYLSEERCKVVVNYLVSKGIKPIRLVAKGYGESMPIAENSTEEGRSLNRRVEIKVLNVDMTARKIKESTNKRFKMSSQASRKK